MKNRSQLSGLLPPVGTPACPRSDCFPEAMPWGFVVAAMLAGAALGLIAQSLEPIEESLLDGGLVLSGLVSYPHQSTMGFLYHGVWTLLYQAGALVLQTGVGYTAANLLFLAIPPALLTGAFALLLHGVTRRPLFSLAAAIACFLNGDLAMPFGSSDYPLLGTSWAMPSPHSPGRFGSALAAFSIAALIGGRQMLAVFTAMVLIAVHPVIGVFVAGMFIIGLGGAHLLWRQTAWNPVLVGLSVGTGVVLASLAAFLLMRPEMPHVSEATNRIYLDAYYAFWEDHRNRQASFRKFVSLVVLFVVTSASLLMILMLHRGRRGATDAGAITLLAIIATSTALFVLQHWDKTALPEFVIRAIPGRLINIQASLVLPLVVGSAVLLFDDASRRRRQLRPSGTALPFASHFSNALFAGFVLALVVRGLLVGHAIFVRHDREEQAPLREFAEIDRTFWTRVRALKLDGLVLVPPELSLRALRYGHLPIALDGTAIDTIPYLPRLAAGVGTLVESAYGISFFRPPASLKFTGSLLGADVREYWACLTAAAWRRTAQQFNIVALLAPADWTVGLPLLLSDDQYALYAMPEKDFRTANTIEETCATVQ